MTRNRQGGLEEESFLVSFAMLLKRNRSAGPLDSCRVKHRESRVARKLRHAVDIHRPIPFNDCPSVVQLAVVLSEGLGLKEDVMKWVETKVKGMSDSVKHLPPSPISTVESSGRAKEKKEARWRMLR